MATAAVAGAFPADRSMDKRKLIAFFAMVFGMFMSILDIQIVSASLAEIQAGLGAGSDEVAWVQTSYLIAEVIMIPLSGTLARILSTRVLFSICAAGFTIASALCATATNIEQMIVYRAIQGFIGGGMIPSVFAAAFTIFPPSKRAVVSPIIGLVATLAPTIGPTVGGYLSHAFSWHWLFLVNIVPGILVTAVAWSMIDFDEPEMSLWKKFDWWGLLSMALFLGSLEYVLEEGNNKDWFSDEHIVVGSLVMLAGAVVFFWRAFRVEFPVVDLRAFANRNFAFGSLFSFVMGIGLYGLTYLYPLYLGRIRGYDSLMIGETMFVSGLAMFFTAPVAGMLSNRLDPRVMMAIGFLGFALGHLSDDRAHGRLGFLRTAHPADPARLLDDAVHGADQQHRTRDAAACPHPERVGSLQPDPQPRRRRGTCHHQHHADAALRRTLCAAFGASELRQSRRPQLAGQRRCQLQQLRARRRRGCAAEAFRHGHAAILAVVLHRRLHGSDGAVREPDLAGHDDLQAIRPGRRRRRPLIPSSTAGRGCRRCGGPFCFAEMPWPSVF
jgi:drug resistance transporter, EmrB/QacA subfamily